MASCSGHRGKFTLNKDEINTAYGFFENRRMRELHNYLEPFLKLNDPYALYFTSHYSLPEWNESGEEFDQRTSNLRIEAAEAGIAPAMYQLAGDYFNGDVVQKNVQKGRAYMERAIALGHGPSKFSAGMYFYYGAHGYPEDVEKAIELVSEAVKDKVEGAAEALEQIKKGVR